MRLCTLEYRDEEEENSEDEREEEEFDRVMNAIKSRKRARIV